MDKQTALCNVYAYWQSVSHNEGDDAERKSVFLQNSVVPTAVDDSRNTYFSL